MSKHSHISWLLSAAGLLILILDGKTALSGAVDGIELCMKTVIPALFPFFVLSAAFLRSAPSCLGWEKVTSSLLGMPRGTGSLMLPCFLGGYPVGAQSVYQAYSDGLLQKQAAEKLLAFCNNAGPAFVFGVLGQMFPKPWMPWALWGIHIAGAMIAAQCVSGVDAAADFDKQQKKTESNLMSSTVLTMGIVCGWIILFRVLIAFLDRWFLWLLPQTLRVAFVGLLELSNGCCELIQVPSIGTRFILCSGMLAAGGLCVTAQTLSVTQGLSLRYYCLGKLIQIFVSLILSYSLMYQAVLPLVLLPLPLLYRFRKKRGGNRVLSGV